MIILNQENAGIISKTFSNQALRPFAIRVRFAFKNGRSTIRDSLEPFVLDKGFRAGSKKNRRISSPSVFFMQKNHQLLFES